MLSFAYVLCDSLTLVKAIRSHIWEFTELFTNYIKITQSDHSVMVGCQVFLIFEDFHKKTDTLIHYYQNCSTFLIDFK